MKKKNALEIKKIMARRLRESNAINKEWNNLPSLYAEYHDLIVNLKDAKNIKSSVVKLDAVVDRLMVCKLALGYEIGKEETINDSQN